MDDVQNKIKNINVNFFWFKKSIAILVKFAYF